jgi:hypothetical protein
VWQVNAQVARDSGTSTKLPCLEIEQIFYDAEGDAPRHPV